jgi:hypothetical protein
MKRTPKPKPELSPEFAACDRLTNDGASSSAAIRRRIALIAAERHLDPSETKALLKGRWLTLRHLGLFAEKHDLRVDWLLCGDLKAHPRRTTAATFGGGRPYTSAEFAEAIERLDPKAREFITSYMRLLLDGGGAA